MLNEENIEFDVISTLFAITMLSVWIESEREQQNVFIDIGTLEWRLKFVTYLDTQMTTK